MASGRQQRSWIGPFRRECLGWSVWARIWRPRERAVELAGTRPEAWASVGLHPHDASRLEEEWESLVRLAESPRVVAIGETGFDFHYRHSDEESQSEAFRRHIRLASALGLALVVHTREAWDRTFETLEDEGVPARTVIHCFTGGPTEAERRQRLWGPMFPSAGSLRFPRPTTCAQRQRPWRLARTGCSSRPTHRSSPRRPIGER